MPSNRTLTAKWLWPLGLSCCMHLQAQEQKGISSVEYGSRLDSAERSMALRAALQNAVDSWVAEKHPSHTANYQQVREEIHSNIDDYVLSHQLIDEDHGQKGSFKVLLRARLNEPLLLKKLLKPSDNVRDSTYLTFVFVAREQPKNSTGKKWDVSTTNEVNSAMGQVFADARFKVVDASLVGTDSANLDINLFIDDYKIGNDIHPDAKRDAYRVLSSLKPGEEIHYFAIGTLDIEAATIDPSSGNTRIAVAVTGEVWSIQERGTVVAKVGPVTISGEGSSEIVARNNALTLAAKRAASTLVAQLSSHTIQ